jgi:putative membrane protein
MEQFGTRVIARKEDRSGFLIFVSLAERYTRIVADEGIAARVPQSERQTAVDALVTHTRDGRIADGSITAVNVRGNKLARHFRRTETNRDD